MISYQKPPEVRSGLRLHQNENTGGCSPRVIEALRKLRADEISQYPPSVDATEAVAKYFNVLVENVCLTNGLNEGIMALSIAQLKSTANSRAAEAIVPEPAFEIFRIHIAVAGGKLVQVMPRPDFILPLDEVLTAIAPQTRVVFLTNPNNPTGVSMPLDSISTIARRVPGNAIVFVDEAYADFAGVSFISKLAEFTNVVVGRSFSKSFGLAGLRIGCLIGNPRTLEPIRRAVPVHSLNIAALTAIQAALDDRDHFENYLRQVAQSKELLYAACDRLGLKYWPSDANFILIDLGGSTESVLKGLAARGIHVRDRSSEPGCVGCIRVSTGIVQHTQQFIAALGKILCATQS